MGDNALPLLSVIVCTYNRAELLPLCLQSLAEQTLEKSLYEVIVVNNNSIDSTQEIAHGFAARYANFHVVNESKQGLSHARNRGFVEALGKYVAYIDDDAKASPQWCELILYAFKTVSPKPVAVGGQIHPWYETAPPAWFTDDFEIRTWGSEAGFLHPSRARTGFSGSNMAFPKNILQAYGGFSPDYGVVGGKLRMGEDTELFGWIFEKEPWFWYDPSIKVFHWVPVRNMRVGYRFWRAVKGGESCASMQSRRASLNSYLKSLLFLGFLVIKLPFVLIVCKKKISGFVKSIEEIGSVIGHLKGTLFFR